MRSPSVGTRDRHRPEQLIVFTGIRTAAHLKAHHSISYADAFALALAQQEQAILLTGDPEFQQVASLAAIEWLPQA